MATEQVEVARVDAGAIDSLLTIDAASFLRPWNRAMYESAFASPLTRVFVVAVDGAAVAYCSAAVLPGELHIQNVAVLPEFRRRGLARRLLEAVLDRAAGEGAVEATLEVRRSNQPALALYEGLGFRTAAVRVDYYRDPVEDALILWRRAHPAEAG